MRKPKVRYYADTDSLIIDLADRPGVEAEEVAEDVVLSFDENDKVVAVEILSGAKGLFSDLLRHSQRQSAGSKT